MFKWNQFLSRWLPVVFHMLIIFLSSAQPSSILPDFDWLDTLIKKGGHMVGYALLAFLFWRALGFKKEKRWLVWLLTITYAITDEFHQSFVPGRHPSAWDVMIFDNLGALTSLWLTSRLGKQKSPGSARPIAPQAGH